MSRAKRGVKARRRRNRVLSLAKGYRGSRHRLFRTAIHVVRRGLAYAYRDRRNKKREFRRLWIIRINAAARAHGLRYSEFMNGLRKQGVAIDRSVLAYLAHRDQPAFVQLVETAKVGLGRA